MNYSDKELLAEVETSITTLVRMDANRYGVDLYVDYLLNEKGSDLVVLTATLIEALSLAKTADSRHMTSKVLSVYLGRPQAKDCDHIGGRKEFLDTVDFCSKCGDTLDKD